MLLDLNLDLLKDHKPRLLRLAVMVAGFFLAAGVFSVFIESWAPVKSLVAVLAIDATPQAADEVAAITKLFLFIFQPSVLIFTAVIESTGLFFSQLDRVRIVSLLSYPIPRWKVFASRKVYLGTLIVGLTVLSTGFYLLGRSIVNFVEPFWSITAYIPGLILLVLIFTNLVIIASGITKRAWVRAGLVMILLFLSYTIYFLPELANVNSIVRYFSIVAAYGGVKIGLPHPGFWNYIVLIALNISVTWASWQVFEKSDLSAPHN